MENPKEPLRHILQGSLEALQKAIDYASCHDLESELIALDLTYCLVQRIGADDYDPHRDKETLRALLFQ